ncbi:hypothetical protein [Prauserella muralis]|uniref:Uncharacterized protein n=1 Tax=Prauserella muralis TaxID=588067 RepID=A0A2V4BFU5_9PSEU|nr:hypothetical protein [Prauserella muralis]PXY28469.1 hypothetical protein BAY60_17455 [Prauserella muralis]TWE22073.1 hypothetical protein FHX69_3306 [Prauserella muralis]
MRWKETITAAGAVLLLATACGQQPGSGSLPAREAGNSVEAPSGELTKVPGRKPAQPPSEQPPSEPGADGRAVPPERVDGSALPRGYPVDVSVSADGRALTIIGQEGGCSQASAEVGDQARQRVAVTMVETKLADKNVMCTMDMRYPPITVRLDQPLGDRTVVLDYVRRTA